MIHRNDERVFRVVELTCYVAMFLSPLAVKIAGVQAMRSYFMPVMFVVSGAVGLMFLTRFFIYAHPENIGDRTRAEFIAFPRNTKLLLLVGYAMSGPMFVLGLVGVVSPKMFERAITAVSPMRLIADSGEVAVVFVSLIILAGAVIFIGAARALPTLLKLGITILVLLLIFGLKLLRW